MIDGIMKEFKLDFPTQPGVYQMLNSQGQIIYVGKAKNLKKRISSYFRKEHVDRKTAIMVEQIADIQVTITANEVEALLLEDNLVKEHRPRYNILLRDDKSYPYLFLSKDEDFPRMDFHRGPKRQPGYYFGPYPHAGAVRENLALIQKLFKLRQCSNNFFQHRTRPCLQYQIQRCTAPCVGYVTIEAYGEQVQHTLLYFSGKNEEIIADLTEKMENASQHFQFEKAAHYRDQIALLRKLQGQQSMVSDGGNIDILGMAALGEDVAVVVVFVRHGRVIGNKAFFPRVPLEEGLKQVLPSFILQYYLNPLHGEDPIERIVSSKKVEDKEALQGALEARLQRNILITDRKQAVFRHWQAMADINAAYALSQHQAKHNKIATQLEALRKELHLPNPISRIECFDISHTSGEAAVASCVVFNDQGPLTSDYRRFNIKDIQPGDDYAAIRQALSRHYFYLKSEERPLPDLLVIDGGQGQLRQAIEVLEELQVSGVNLLAISKGPSRKAGLEQLWMGGQKTSIRLPENSSALHILQTIRDEAHRFAITSHRRKRGKIGLTSTLESIEGIGPKRRRDLLRYFGGLQGIQQAGVADLMKVNGISEELAQRIYDHFH